MFSLGSGTMSPSFTFIVTPPADPHVFYTCTRSQLGQFGMSNTMQGGVAYYLCWGFFFASCHQRELKMFWS